MLKTAATAVVMALSVTASPQTYAPAGEIHIGGLDRFDYLTVDSAARRLHPSHGAEVVVIDTTTDKAVGRTPNVAGDDRTRGVPDSLRVLVNAPSK
jgi:hypothetical protein